NWNYFGARYYDPLIGRWFVRDPLHNSLIPKDLVQVPDFFVSPYVYTLNNPIRFIDLNGKAVGTIQVEARILAGGTFSGALGIAVDHHKNVAVFFTGTAGFGGGIGGSIGANVTVYPAAANINDISGFGGGIGAFAGFATTFLAVEGNISFQSNDFRLGGTAGIPFAGAGIGIGAFAEGSYTHFLTTTTLGELLKNSSDFLKNPIVQQLQAELGISAEELVKLIEDLQKQVQKVQEEQEENENDRENKK
ncbi:MAG: RHS repeat domain-containing protein, partial [Nitrosopumilaceae archaeon]